jgi:lysophospholipase L1-like esterase
LQTNAAKLCLLKYGIVLIALLFCLLPCRAQQMPLQAIRSYPFIHPEYNKISFPTGLDSFFAALAALKTSGTGQLNIVHIGDSHVQPHINTGVVKRHFQAFFGNAGYGLLFPYRLARTNGPLDYTPVSTYRWQHSRLSYPESNSHCGIAGYLLQTTLPNAGIRFNLRSHSFRNLLLFADPGEGAWSVQTSSSLFPLTHTAATAGDSLLTRWQPGEAGNSFTLTVSGPGTKKLYGLYIADTSAGIVYNSIGVNGATYSDYNNNPLFWKQLAALHAGLYIVSLGTNEAQKPIDENFISEVDSLVQQIRQINPAAGIILTTPADSYLRRKSPNKNLQNLHEQLYRYCFEHNIALWDLYVLTGGFGSAKSWLKQGFLNKDRVHYTAAGYTLQGTLFSNALTTAYNDYLERQHGSGGPSLR